MNISDEILADILVQLNLAFDAFKLQENADIVTIDFLRDRRARIENFSSQEEKTTPDRAITISLLNEIIEHNNYNLSEDGQQELFNFIVTNVILKEKNDF